MRPPPSCARDARFCGHTAECQQAADRDTLRLAIAHATGAPLLPPLLDTSGATAATASAGAPLRERSAPTHSYVGILEDLDASLAVFAAILPEFFSPPPSSSARRGARRGDPPRDRRALRTAKATAGDSGDGMERLKVTGGALANASVSDENHRVLETLNALDLEVRDGGDLSLVVSSPLCFCHPLEKTIRL